MLSLIQLLEVFHFCFLEKLLKISEPKFYVLKGGVNLRFFFKSPRYSEDLDLDVLGGTVSTLKKNCYKILNDSAFKRTLRTYGIEELLLSDPEKAKQTNTTQRFRLRLVTTAGEKLPTKIEFSRRPEKEKSILEQVDSEISYPYQKLSFRCQHYTGESALLQKIKALAYRKTPQTRDAFDMDWLLSSGILPDLKHLSREIQEQAKKNILSLNQKDFEGQVLEFLEEDFPKIYKNKKSWEELQFRVLKIFQ